MNITKTGSVR